MLLAILDEIRELELYEVDVDYDWEEEPFTWETLFDFDEFIDERLNKIPGIKKRVKKKEGC